MRSKTDLVAEIVDERTRNNPAFPDLVEEAEARRELARTLGLDGDGDVREGARESERPPNRT